MGRPRFVLKPVGWMLSPELVASLRQRSSASAGRPAALDVAATRATPTSRTASPRRAWRPVAPGLVDPRRRRGDTAGRRSPAGQRRAVVRLRAPTSATASPRCTDRLSAAGRPALVDVSPAARSPSAAERGRRRQRDHRGIAAALRSRWWLRATRARLPRGEFLFVGGDTAYHVADHTSLVNRVQAPMYWAEPALRAPV
jgi:hypothetical protein